MHLSTSAVCNYLNATPSSRCFVEGEAVLRAEHLLLCGITYKLSNKWTVRAYCVQSSSIKTDPHEVTGVLKLGDNITIEGFTCTCKAGLSGTCKHVSATLQFCTRKPLEKLEELSSTQVDCMWKKRKVQIDEKYEPKPLHETDCFQDIMKKQKKHVTIPSEDLFQQAVVAAPNSEFALQLKGRRQSIAILQNTKFTPPDYVKTILENAEEASFLTSLEADTELLQDCCLQVLTSLQVNTAEALCTDQGTAKWKMCRKNKITGSTCYSIYTFGKADWSVKLKNFFNPKDVKTKQMKHGIEAEPLAFSIFEQNNPSYQIKRLGVFVCKSFPWLAYSPDGVTFCSGKPERLLEIKCPYLGKIKSGVEVLRTLPYLDENFRLKAKHSYYAQVQFGMALLNLQYCDFIIFFTKDNNHLHITIPFDETFAHNLLSVCSEKYLNKMLHYLCKI